MCFQLDFNVILQELDEVLDEHDMNMNQLVCSIKRQSLDYELIKKAYDAVGR